MTEVEMLKSQLAKQAKAHVRFKRRTRVMWERAVSLKREQMRSLVTQRDAARERVAELERERDECVEMRRIYDSLNHELRRAGQEGLARVVELTKERDAALAQVAALRAALVALMPWVAAPPSDGAKALEQAQKALASTPAPVCHGACLTAAEVGVAVAGNPIAYAHPQCELHNPAPDILRRVAGLVRRECYDAWASSPEVPFLEDVDVDAIIARATRG